jgi:hypothetical protein
VTHSGTLALNCFGAADTNRLDSDFDREIEVDKDGMVVTYPGLFKRVL